MIKEQRLYKKYNKNAFDKQAEREGKNVPNSNNKWIRMSQEYSKIIFDKLFKQEVL